MLSHDGSCDNEAAIPCWSLCPALGCFNSTGCWRGGTSEVVGSQRPTGAVKFGLGAPKGTVTALLSVSGAGEMVGSGKGRAPLGFWVCLVGVDRGRWKLGASHKAFAPGTAPRQVALSQPGAVDMWPAMGRHGHRHGRWCGSLRLKTLSKAMYTPQEFWGCHGNDRSGR